MMMSARFLTLLMREPGNHFYWLCLVITLTITPIITSTPIASTITTTTTTTASTTPLSPAANSSRIDLWQYLPGTWSSFCTLDYDLDPEVNATLTCHVTSGQQTVWRLADFRDSLSSLVNSTGLEVAVQIQCEAGANISLPFPFRAPGLVKLTVRHCGLLNKWADFATPARRLGDWLRVQELRSCTWLNDPGEFALVLRNLPLMDSHFECGQDSTLVRKVSYNISQFELPPPNLAALNSSSSSASGDLQQHGKVPGLSGFQDAQGSKNTSATDLASLAAGLLQSLMNKTGSDLHLDPAANQSANSSGGVMATDAPAGAGKERFGKGSNSSADASDDLLQTLIDLDTLKTQCRFEHLQVLDESFSKDTNVNHFEFLVKDSTYPQLKTLNFTGIGLLEIPKELRESRRKFPGSKLGVIDISYNYVQELGMIPAYPSRGIPTHLIVRHNNISRLSLKMFQDLALVPDFTVDLKGNPIACDCALKELVHQLGQGQEEEGPWTAPGMSYYRRHLASLACATPAQLSGRGLGSLSVDDLPCPVAVADLRPVMAVMGVVVVVLLLLLVLAVRYRKEVRILMYTRVNILLPCGLPPSASLPEKTYDAFVAYAHQDSEWVLNNLMKRLEDAEGPPKGRRPCRLCLHQRDFVVGKAIIDNIVDCIAASRHTIVVLTNSFVRSGWAMEELQQAYHQSLEERSRHLVVVMLEKVEERHMSPALRRCCKTFTYLQVSDAFFWDRLLYSIQVGGRKSSDRTPTPPADDSGSYTITNTNTSNTSNKSNNGTDVGLQPKKETENGWSTEGWGVMEPDFDKQMPFPETLRTLSVDSGFSLASTDTQQVTLSLSDV